MPQSTESQRVRHNRVTDQQLKFLENEHEKRYQQPGEGEVTAQRSEAEVIAQRSEGGVTAPDHRVRSVP